VRHRRRISLPTNRIYPVDDWAIVERQLDLDRVPVTEALFALSNGYIGMRATPEEGRPTFENGTYLNGVYESWQILYGESAYGFTKTGQTIVNVADTKSIKLYVDDEFFNPESSEIVRWERRLNMRDGTLDREVVWQTPGGKHVQIVSRRLVSFAERHLCATWYEVTLLDAEGPMVISSEIVVPSQEESARDEEEIEDPRRGTVLPGRVLKPLLQTDGGLRAVLVHRTAKSGILVAAGIDHALDTRCEVRTLTKTTERFGQIVFEIDARAGETIRLEKYAAYHHAFTASPEQLAARTEWTLDRAKRHGFAAILSDQQRYVADFWERSDVEVELDPAARENGGWLQQALRFNLFHLLQATARTDGAGLPAKGLTGSAYEGHYFWDAEIYVLPFLVYTAPDVARGLLLHRYKQLPHARERARLLNQRGAKYPWRTINGDEASAYYAAGTAQYHINADLAYAIRKYVEATGDETFLAEKGAEILVETARLWTDLGFHSSRQDGKFVIHGVTGPDEYTTVVNNNTFTNLMARENLRYAGEVVERLEREHPERYEELVERTGLARSELAEWRRAAEAMFVPFDERLGIHPQDDDFLDKEMWDFESTPADAYPLLLHYHPLVIYRFQVIKQTDVVLAMFLLPEEFTPEQKRRNFTYYDAITTGDSSLSAPIQAILALELGRGDLAREYTAQGVLMDLADVHGNARDGCHIAAMGGSWMIVTYGIAGLRDRGGKLSFDPRMPVWWRSLRFRLQHRGRTLQVELTASSARYTLLDGEELELEHQGEAIMLTAAEPVAERHETHEPIVSTSAGGA
jgi:alpha,alpha-trehalose phosphorylase